MKLKLKFLAAALTLAAAGSANATIVDGSTGNGELFMTVWDQAGNQSYTLDLNLTMNDFLSGIAVSGASYSYLADANMTSFLAGVSDVSSLIFAIGAMDNSGATTTDTYRYISSASVIDPGTTVTNTNLKQLGTSGDTFLGNTNGLIGSANSLIVTDPSIVAYAGSAQWGTNWGNKANFTSTGLIGSDEVVDSSDLGMYFLTQTSGTFADRNKPSAYAAIMQGNGQVFANLSRSGNLTIAGAAVAPVPEADTWAMLLAGLGMVGMIARRRRMV